MALTTSDTIAIFENASDSAAVQFRAPGMSVELILRETPEYLGALTCTDSNSNQIGAQTFNLDLSELTAIETGFEDALIVVRSAIEQAVKARLDAIPANSGKTIAYG